MYIQKIEIKNFKLFRETEFIFHQNFNLVIGINGSGKTSLLRAIAVSLGGWANAYINSEENLRPIKANEVREIQKDARFDKTKETYSKERDINSILYDFMGLSKRTKEYENRVDNLFGYLDDEKVEEAESLLNELKVDYGEKDSIVIEAQTMLDILKEL